MSKSPQRPWITEKNLNNPATQVFKAAPEKARSKFKRGFAEASRWVHIYLSMISFAVLLFFAVTGLTLNHPDWFADQQSTAEEAGAMNKGWVNDPDTSKIKKLEVVEQLRSAHNLKGAVSEFRMDDNECSVSFKGPGYSADAFINRTDGKYTVTVIRSGLVAVMNDLHKGRDSGKGWAWLIDVSAVLMTVVSLSGIILICFLKKKRLNGLLIAFFGGLACYVIYKIFVP